MNGRALSLAVNCLLSLSAAGTLCAEPPSATPLVIGGPTMGTTYRVQVVDANEGEAAQIRAAIEGVLADVDRRLSTYRNDSEISRFNRAPAGEWFAVSPSTAAIVDRSLEFCRQTGGALDVTVGPLVRLWHFGPQTIATARSTADITPPADKAIDAARVLVGYAKLEVRLDPPALRKRVDGLEVDLSAVGEGYAIDRLVEELTRRGHENFLIELGGEVCARGNHADGKLWRVAIERPTDDQPTIQTAVSLTNAALATSGDYRRYFEHSGRRYSHIIDPATGRPITHALASVTVVADDGLTADAWDTAILVLGPERGHESAVEHNIAALLITREGDRFVAQETPAWRERFATASSSSPAGPQRRLP